MKINIKGYKNIEELIYEIDDNKVNVLIGISGSGKSSIVGALLEVDVDKNRKINYTGEVISSIDGIENPIISVFDETSLDKYLFDKQKENNVYNVLIDNEMEYMDARIHLENRLVEINDIINLKTNKYLELKNLEKQLVGTLNANNTLRANSTIIKAKKSLTEIGRSNVYSYLNELSPKHADWIVQGVDYIDEENNECPFCEKKLNAKKRKIIDKIGDVDLKSQTRISQTIESSEGYLLETTPFTLRGIKQLEKEMIKISLALKEFDKLKNDIEKLYDVDLSFENLSFQYEKELYEVFPLLEDPVKKLHRRRISLKNNFDKAKENTKNIFSRKLNNINNIIESLGIPYKMTAKYRRNKIKGYKLYHTDDDSRAERVDGLSTGERKIISLIFFALEQENQENDLIILDDPVSSYDENRRYSLYRYITETLRGKTILMLSHDQLFAKFAVNDQRHIIGNVSYFENTESISLVSIDKDDFENINKYIIERIRGSNSYIQKIINLRYYYELNRKRDIYTYVTKILKKENMSNWLINKGLNEYDLISTINNDIGISLEHLNEDYFNNVNIENLSIMEKIFILRNMNTNKTLKSELSNYVHLSARFVISLNPYKFSFASNYVIKAIEDKLENIHNF